MENDIRNLVPPYLIIDGNGSTEFHSLEAGSTAFVGSGSSCKIKLAGVGVSSIHCMLEIGSENQMKVQDWNTGTTIVNDTTVELEQVLNSGDQLKIVDHVMVPVLTAQHHETVVRELTGGIVNNSNELKAASAEPNEVAEACETEAPTEPEDTTFCSTDDFIAEVQSFNSGLNPKIEDAVEVTEPTSKDEFVYDVDADLGETSEIESFDADVPAFEYGAAGYVDTSTDEETLAEELQLLHTEVDQLRFEIAQRDSQLRELAQRNDSDEDVIDSAQTEKLVCRLEELLDELQRSDERVRGMEELVRCSDQATQDEQEERRQLESWFTELEHRVSQRELESAAEIKRLAQRLAESQEGQKHAEMQLGRLLDQRSDGSEVATSSAGEAAVAEGFQHQIEKLREAVQQLHGENEELRRVSTANAHDVEQVAKLKETEQRLAEVQLETSRERAEMSRQRAELQALKSELELRLSEPRIMDQADTRVRAMREHLNELHQQEQAVKQERRKNSLGGRISKLLGRVGKQEAV